MSEQKSSKDSKRGKGKGKDKEKGAQKWHRMVVFGDSLSVSPNRFEEEFPPIPDPGNKHHFGSRFSNGWTMVEYLRDSLNIPTSRFHNFATGGETSDDMMQTQFPMFVDLKFDMKLGQSEEHAELFVVFGGSNDFAPFLMRLGTDPMKGVKEFLFGKLSQEMADMMDETVERIVQIMDNLYHCAQARYFFVPNIPNVVSDLPFTKKVFNKYHDKLKKAIKKFQKLYKDATVVIWDLSSVITDMQAHPNKFGLTQVSLFKNHEKSQSPPEETLFWDGAGHFTTKAHSELSVNALKCLQKATPDVQVMERPEPVEEKEWSCIKCSYANKPRRRRCEMCSATKNSMAVSFQDSHPRELEAMKTEWACGTCTLFNPPMTARCAACDSRPTQEQLRNNRSSNPEPSESSEPQPSNSENPNSPSSSSAEVAPAEAAAAAASSSSNSVASDPSQNGHAPVSEWECAMCTFINRPGLTNCDVCLAAPQASHA